MASFVDVPGHERFVRNMLAGAHGIDAVLLVVAADESVMPQTREHFHICRLWASPRAGRPQQMRRLPTPTCKRWRRWKCASSSRGPSWMDRPSSRVSSRTGQGLDRSEGSSAHPRPRDPAAAGRGPLAPARGSRLHSPRVWHGGDGDARVRHAGCRGGDRSPALGPPRAGARPAGPRRGRGARRGGTSHRREPERPGRAGPRAGTWSPGRGRCVPPRSSTPS